MFLNRLESQVASSKILNIYTVFQLQFLALGSLRLGNMNNFTGVYFVLILERFFQITVSLRMSTRTTFVFQKLSQ